MKYQDLQDEIDKLRFQRDQAVASLSEERAMANSLEQTLAARTEHRDQLDAARQHLIQRNEELTAQRNALVMQLDDKVAELADCKRSRDSLSSECKRLDPVTASAQLHDRAHQRLNTAEERIHHLESRLNQLERYGAPKV